MKRYALKAINDDETVCSVCGKIELRRVMWLVELAADGSEQGEPFAVGTSCGARMMGYSVAKVRKAADNFASNVENQRYFMARSKARELGYNEKLNELHDIAISQKFTFAQRQAHPLYAEAMRIEAKAREWAELQSIVIEL